ncbi:MAG: hypothetical protein N2055_11945 [Tepidimonas taiwanensis]|nr:hypothetical protein [Tepidimonas taiwanensis]
MPPAATVQDWPKELRAQIQAVRALLTATPQPPEALAARFKRQPARAVEAVLHALQALQALQALGLASHGPAGWSTLPGPSIETPP